MKLWYPSTSKSRNGFCYLEARRICEAVPPPSRCADLQCLGIFNINLNGANIRLCPRDPTKSHEILHAWFRWIRNSSRESKSRNSTEVHPVVCPWNVLVGARESPVDDRAWSWYWAGTPETPVHDRNCVDEWITIRFEVNQMASVNVAIHFALLPLAIRLL